jgi:hypothetical protein
MKLQRKTSKTAKAYLLKLDHENANHPKPKNVEKSKSAEEKHLWHQRAKKRTEINSK